MERFVRRKVVSLLLALAFAGTVTGLTISTQLERINLTDVQFADTDFVLRNMTTETTTISAFPVVESRAITTVDSNTQTHVINLPAGANVGDLLLVVFTIDSEETAPLTFPDGWTKFDKIVSTYEAATTVIAYKTADGTEGSSISITSNSQEKSATVVFRITGYDGVPEIALSPASGVNAFPDPPSLSPTGGMKGYLWVAVAGHDGTAICTAAPSGYDNLQSPSTSGQATSSNVGTCTAERLLETGSEDPGTFSMGEADEWAAQTIAISPVSDGGDQITITVDLQNMDTVQHSANVTIRLLNSTGDVIVSEVQETGIVAANGVVSLSFVFSGDGLIAEFHSILIVVVQDD